MRFQTYRRARLHQVVKRAAAEQSSFLQQLGRRAAVGGAAGGVIGGAGGALRGQTADSLVGGTVRGGLTGAGAGAGSLLGQHLAQLLASRLGMDDQGRGVNLVGLLGGGLAGGLLGNRLGAALKKEQQPEIKWASEKRALSQQSLLDALSYAGRATRLGARKAWRAVNPERNFRRAATSPSDTNTARELLKGTSKTIGLGLAGTGGILGLGKAVLPAKTEPKTAAAQTEKQAFWANCGDRYIVLKGEHRGRIGVCEKHTRSDKTEEYVDEDGAKVTKRKETCELTIKFSDGQTFSTDTPDGQIRSYYGDKQDRDEDSIKDRNSDAPCEAKSAAAMDPEKVQTERQKLAAVIRRVINGDEGLEQIIQHLKSARSKKQDG